MMLNGGMERQERDGEGWLHMEMRRENTPSHFGLAHFAGQELSSATRRLQIVHKSNTINREATPALQRQEKTPAQYFVARCSKRGHPSTVVTRQPTPYYRLAICPLSYSSIRSRKSAPIVINMSWNK